jgi:integrase
MAKRSADRPDFRAIDRIVRSLPPPEKPKPNLVYKERRLREHHQLTGPWVDGLAVCVSAAGARSWRLNYRAAGIERTYTFGSIEAWPADKAWPEARELRRIVDQGGDPQKDRRTAQEAPTVNDLVDKFEAEHLPKRRPSTIRGYSAMLRQHVRPELGKKKVAAVEFEDIERLHASVRKKAPYAANRLHSLLSVMFNRAIAWKMRTDNPAKGLERAPEHRRERFLSPAEIARLSDVLTNHPEQASANVVRLLLLTGSRRGEVLGATWDQFNLSAGIWTKPASTTKQNKSHRLPLSAPALQLLTEMEAKADQENARRQRHSLKPLVFLFPGVDGRPLREIKHFWASICRKAEIDGVRLHDLRHTHASILASLGMSLPIIGALLGHTQAATTQRYAHLLDDPLRAAVDRLGAVVTGGKEGGEVIPLTGRRA